MFTTENKGLGIAVNLIHVGTLSGAGGLLANGQWKTALICALAAAACILIVATAIGFSELIQERFRKLTYEKNQRRLVRGGAKKVKGRGGPPRRKSRA